MAEDLRKLDCQTFVDDLCAEYRKVDELLGFPRNGYAMYEDRNSGKVVFHVVRYARNVRAILLYKAMIDRLDLFFISVEHFQGITSLHRSMGTDFTKDFQEYFFVSTMTDALRSALDIYAKILGVYFDLPGRDNIGFSFNTLIRPLKEICPDLAKACNSLYQNEHFKLLKEFRDCEKHTGRPDLDVKIKTTQDSMDIDFKRLDPIESKKLARASGNCIRTFRELLRTTSVALRRWGPAYHSPHDMQAGEGPDGSYYGLPKEGARE